MIPHRPFMQRPVHTSYGRVKPNVDGCLFAWTGKKNIFLKILMYHGLQNVGLLRALYTSCYCHIILEWTTSLDTSSSTLFVCRGGDCVQRDLSPTSGYTGISARRRYQFWERDLSPTFKRISDRICAASINLVNHKLIVISAYAPTLEVREANPELRELFYNQLDSTVSRDS